MPFIYNATDEEVTVRAHGNWFNFKPKQKKMMQPELVQFISSQKSYMGFVALGDEFEDPNYSETEEGKKKLAEATVAGVNNRIAHLRWIIRNNQESLKNDLRLKNVDADPAAYMTDGEMAALEELARYQTKGNDETQKRIERVKQLQELLAKGES